MPGRHLAEILTKEQVVNALEYLISHPEGKLNRSSKWDLIYKGHIFPPKEVVEYAAKLAQIPNWEKYRNTGGTGTRNPLEAMAIPSLSIVSKSTADHLVSNHNSKSPNKAIQTSMVKETQIPLNIILYGPPGTGKTYHSINKALEIVAPDVYEKNKGNRNEITKVFRDMLIKDWDDATGQITFVTFHQSMSYEDFIEGIKPVKPETGTSIRYEIVDGIFKRLCLEATKEKGFWITIDDIKKPLTKELFKELYYAFSENLPPHTKPTSEIILKTKEGYDFELFKNTANSIVVKAGSQRSNQHISLTELQSVLFDDKAPLYVSYEQIIIDKLLEGRNFEKSSIDNSTKNFVLIIDEINRGNVSQIYGELITLIEDSKRRGETEELTVTLPYSKKPFSVPKNLYIIGTMNTADRSVEALDTALRRRFVFEEMLPTPELLNSYQRIKDLWVKYKHTYNGDQEWVEAEKAFIEVFGMNIIDKEGYEDLKPFADDVDNELANVVAEDFKSVVSFNGLDLERLLFTVNDRLAALLAKDHAIGHAWFLDVFSLNDLQSAFKNKILPLLQEYFYNNYEKIGLVLGKAFIDQKTAKGIFAKDFNDEENAKSDYEERVIYSLTNPYELTLQNFISIYQ